MCEPLRGKKLLKPENIVSEEAWIFLSEDVKSAVEFYKRYRADPWLLEEEHPEIIDEWFKDEFDETPEKIRKESDLNSLFYEQVDNRDDDDFFSEWLFDYTFKDVIE